MPPGMNDLENEPAYKLFVEDLRSFEGSIDGWYFKFSGENSRTRITKFQIQAEISKVTGFSNEILIVSDDTGKAKTTRTAKVPGDFSWVRPGAYCSIVGNLLDNGKLPHINIIKLAKLNNELLQQLWPLEVVELKKFIAKKVIPDITI